MKKSPDEATPKAKPTKKADTPLLSKEVKGYLKSETSFCILIACLSIFIVFLILSSRYLVTDNIVQDGVSVRDMYAEKSMQVVDTVETEYRRAQARQQISPIYQKQLAVDKIVMDRVVHLMANIEGIRSNRNLRNADKKTEFSNLFDSTSQPSSEVADVILFSDQWDKLYGQTIAATEVLLAQGINAQDYRARKEVIIRSALDSKAKLIPREEKAIVFLIGQNLRPTLMIDEKRTKEAQDSASAAVKPVIKVYGKGDLIVKKGDLVTPLQVGALQKQGHLLDKNRWFSAFGVFLLTSSLLAIVWGYLFRFEYKTFFKPSYLSFLGTAMVLTIGGFTLISDLDSAVAIELYPVPILALMICIFTHARVAILTTMVVLLLCGLTLRIPLESLSVLVVASMMGVFVLARKPVPKDRSDLILSGLAVGLVQGVLILVFSFIYEPSVGLQQHGVVFRFFAGVASGLLSGVMTLGILPIMEGWFKLVTPFTLLELGNHDRPILRRMQFEAPGTFHHSLMVAGLAEAGAEAVGANPVMARVGSLYHDIGKLKRPMFFIENQSYFGVENPHDKLTPRLSKMVVTAHPRDGMEMARQLNLPECIVRFMPEHHGTMVAGYFYNQAVLEEGEDNVNKAQFRYPGPKPQTRETAIVMLADACESAVRSLKNPTVKQIEERVDKIIRQRIEDDQFNECNITFQDIKVIRDTFVRILKAIQHTRIEYPQDVLKALEKKHGLEADLKELLSHMKPDAESASPAKEGDERTAGKKKQAGGGGDVKQQRMPYE